MVTIGLVLGLAVALGLGFGLALVIGRFARPAAPPPPDLRALLDANRELLEQERSRVATELDGKKALIEQQLGSVSEGLTRMGDLVRSLEQDRHRAFGELSNELQRQREGVAALSEHTQQLRETLASSKARGQWGERMADDVLRLAGMIEGINYRRQASLPGSGRPDYTFMLPNELVLHMDVKFPLDNYVRYLDAQNETERCAYRDQFLRDVRARVKELTTRGYLDAGDETVDCLLLFIPNEAVYAFVHEHDRDILEEALGHKIVLCSPLTLFAVLAVVRQAVDNFRLERTSNEILSLLGDFSRQWEKYTTQLESVQRRFDAVHRDYEALMTTRQRALQRPLDKIESLRRDDAPVERPQLAS
jgi:DNA recombination protein RmuC